MQFKDYFSVQAADYARRRPHYPPELFSFVASTTPEHQRALDSGTGNGQAAVGLADYFDEVIATDPSLSQLGNAFQHAKVIYRRAAAEDSGLPPSSVDLVTAAQALHWFDRDKFFAEAHRVLKPRGVCAIWCYTLTRIAPDVDAVVEHFYYDTVGPYWPKERAIVDDGYRSLHFPFDEIEQPPLSIELKWTLTDLIGYLSTWSPVRRFIEANGSDPIALIERELSDAWGAPDWERHVTFPIMMRIGRT